MAGPGGGRFALAVGDLDDDGAVDFVVIQGTRVDVRDGRTQAPRGQFDAFDDTFLGVLGVQVDGGELVATAEVGGRVHVKTFGGRSLAPTGSFFADGGPEA